MPKSGTLPNCKMVLVLRFFAVLVYVKKQQKNGVVKLFCVPQNGTDAFK